MVILIIAEIKNMFMSQDINMPQLEKEMIKDNL